jgi:small subunit ribosomal protein S1
MDQNNAAQEQEAQTAQETSSSEDHQEHTSEKSASMEALLEEEGLGIDFPRQGEIREGIIASLGENEILVSIGTKSEGVIPARELEQIDEDERAKITAGSSILVYVVNPEDSNGNVQLSYLRAREEHDWKQAESLLKSGEAFEGEVVGFNKGGLIVPMGHLRGFIPASQVSVLRRMDASGNTPEQRWGSMVGDSVHVRVIEVDRERRRLIMSERSALQETRESLKDRLLDELNEGDIRTGRVTSLADFGAFVNIEGADGLVHLSEISWDRIEHPREVLNVGQEVEVKVIAVDHERKRIGLSIRQLQEDPWVKKVGDIKEGQLVEGTITHLTKFGAFARLTEDLEGLIHISELSEQRVGHPKEVLKEDDLVTLRVIKIDPERRRIGLSLRKVDSPAYADLDWKTTLAEVVAEQHDEEHPHESSLREAQEEEQSAPSPVEATEEPAPEPQEEEPAEEPAPEPSVDEPAEEPAPEPSVDEPAEEPAPEPSVDEPAEEPAPEPSVDEPAEEPAPELSMDKPAEEPAPEPSVDEPAEEPEPAEEDEPAEEPAPEPSVEEPAEEPAPEPSVDEHAEEPTPEPAEELIPEEGEEPDPKPDEDA